MIRQIVQRSGADPSARGQASPHGLKAISPLHIWASIAIALVGFAIVFFAYQTTFAHALKAIKKDGEISATLRAAALQSEIDKQRAAPAILAADTALKTALVTHDGPQLAAVSQELEDLRAETKSAVIYVLDTKGIAVAASNWRQPDSFVGADYSFRPYFTDAMAKGAAAQFALGTISHRPGLYLSHSVTMAGRTVGAVVVKLEFAGMERDWARLREIAFVTDDSGKVIIVGDPALRFKTPPAPTPSQIAVVSPITSVPGWQMHVYRSNDLAQITALATATIVGLVQVLAVGGTIWIWRRRIHLREKAEADAAYRTRLERNVEQRTQALRHANDKLSQEIKERQEAQLRLNALQADLVQANKLAQLGQITAGVAHEINQPLATIRLLAENASKGLPPEVMAANLDNIIRMSERIGHITGELRAFSRKATGEREPTSVSQAIEGSILLTASRLKAHAVDFDYPKVATDLKVMAERIRLEQVLVNLLQNAFEAVVAVPAPKVALRVEDSENEVRLIVEDNGPGLPETVKKALFIPFTTTKPKGLGLGLVIARDILRDFGGELEADMTRSEGARFIMKLRKVTT